MHKLFRHRIMPFLLLLVSALFVLSACNLGAPNNNQEATLTSEPEDQITVQPTRTIQAEGGVTVFPTFTPFIVSTRPVTAPTSIVLVPNNPPPPTRTPLPSSIVIVSPLSNNVVSGTVQVVGSASHPNFLQYRLEFADQNNPNNVWRSITGVVQQPVIAGVLGVWSTNTGTVPDGLYQVRLRVFLRDGTQQTTQVGNVRVQNQQATPVPTNTTTPRPIAAFTQDRTTGTTPLVVRFTDQSSGEITSRSWSFGDGGSSSIQNPIYTFRTAGTYTVTLTVTGPGGSSNVSREIVVNTPDAPTAGFNSSVTSGDSPLDVSFTSTSSGQITSYNWDFGDGTTSTEQNPSHTFTEPDSYNVILRVTGPGGSSSQIQAITVSDGTIEAPTAQFEVDATEIETGDTVTFTNTTEGESTSFLWDFDGDGLTDSTDISPTFTYDSPSPEGGYTVRLTAIGVGGQTQATETITVSDPPDAPIASFDFSVSGEIAPVEVTFTDTSQGEITGWEWDFNDDGVTDSTTEDPVHTYIEAGTYEVTLTVTGPGGSTTTEVIEISVVTPLDPPTASFAADPTSGAEDLTVTFTNTSNGSQLTYAWDFGDTTTSDIESPTHIYTEPGNYDVSLTVTDPQGQTDTSDITTISVSEEVVIAAPQPGFSVSPETGTVNEVMTFTNSTVGEVTSYSWDFGDGTTSTETSPTHTYTSTSPEGGYTVTLSATGPGGTVETTASVTVNDASPAVPSASFSVSANPATVGVGVTFTDTSTNSPTSWSWDFGDGNTSTEQNPTHTYTAPSPEGGYTVTLTATNDGGDSDPVTQTLTVEDATLDVPTANFTIDTNPVTVGTEVGFIDTSTNTPTSWSWDFGDGNTSTDQNPTHTYTAPSPEGGYTVTLTATNDGGSSQPVTQQITVNAALPDAPEASFTIGANPATVNTGVTFTDTSSNAPTSWSWDFGDGNTSTEQN
ncbi:MAG: PKD domain-containing protein, partial [Chloroflexota bacterium]